MNKEIFYKDKFRKIGNTIFNLGRFTKKVGDQELSNQDISNLRKLSTELLKQIHELNAGRNIFEDNE